MTSISIGYGRHLWDVRAITLLNHPSYIRRWNASSIVYPITIFTIKTSILLFYLRIFTVHKGLRWTIFIGIGCLAVFYSWYLAMAAASVSLCTLDTAALYICRHYYGITLAQGVINVITDFYILLLPIRRMLKLQIRNRKKLGLLAIFLSGLGTCLVSLARCILLGITLKGRDTSWTAALASDLTYDLFLVIPGYWANCLQNRRDQCWNNHSLHAGNTCILPDVQGSQLLCFCKFTFPPCQGLSESCYVTVERRGRIAFRSDQKVERRY